MSAPEHRPAMAPATPRPRFRFEREILTRVRYLVEADTLEQAERLLLATEPEHRPLESEDVVRDRIVTITRL